MTVTPVSVTLPLLVTVMVNVRPTGQDVLPSPDPWRSAIAGFWSAGTCYVGADLVGPALTVVDAGLFVVMTSIHIGLRDRVRRRAGHRRTRRQRRTVGRRADQIGDFGSVTVTLVSVTLPVLVATIV